MTARPVTELRSIDRLSRSSAIAPWCAPTRSRSLSFRKIVASYASQSRAALRTIVSKTGCTSVGERLMTRRISLVAVCCSSVSVRSRLRASSSWKRRTFSMAMTAWSAKVFTSSICLSVKGSTLVFHRTNTPSSAPSRSIGTASTVR